jgi:alkanesulfonate monooxygenase SsuD/methylene tetrahydromethanopterin reductase-like flavin-dependent oxidoreductase (luciferase family)
LPSSEPPCPNHRSPRRRRRNTSSSARRRSTPYGRAYDPLVTLGWIAGWTERIGLGTSIVLVPLHNPMHLAKEVATLQELSGGRFTLGVGMGWHRHEFDFMRVEFTGRGAGEPTRRSG